MKTKLLFASFLFSILGISQETTSNRMIGITMDPTITFYTDGDLEEFAMLDLDIYAGFAIAVNPADSLTYALISVEDETNRNLYRVNPFTGEIELVYDFDIDFFNSGDIGNDGKLYLITGNAADVPGQIYTLDVNTLDFELLFETGLEGPYGLEFNSSNNSVYIFRGDDGEEHFVHRYDLESGDFTEMPLDGAEEMEIHGAFYMEDENKFYITEYFGDLRETVSEEYNVTESVYLSDESGLMDVCIIQTLRAAGPDIEMEACPGDDSTKIELLYEVNDVKWYRDGDLIVGATDQFYYAKTTGDYQALMQIGDSEDYLWSETISVSFYTVPTVTVSQEEDDHLLCPDETIVLDGAVPGGGSVQWTLNGELIADATEASYIASEPGVYNQIKTNLSGCSDSAAVSFIIEAAAVPEVEITLDGDEFLCPDETVDLSGLGTGDLQWYFNGTPIDGETEETIIVSGAGVYNQYVVNEFGCADSAAVGITITEVDNPIVEVSTDEEDLIICSGEMIELEGVGGDIFQWYKDGVAIDGETGTSLDASEEGVYNVLITNEFGCADSAEIGMVVEVILAPVVEVTNIADDHLICPEETIVLDGTVGAEMQWYKDGVELVGETGATYTATEAGEYNMVIVNEEGCSGESDDNYIIEVDPDCGVGIDEYANINVTIYPNPVVDFLNISSDAIITDVVVYDISGAIVLEMHTNSTSKIVLNYSDFSNGVYMVKITTDQGIRMMKTQK